MTRYFVSTPVIEDGLFIDAKSAYDAAMKYTIDVDGFLDEGEQVRVYCIDTRIPFHENACEEFSYHTVPIAVHRGSLKPHMDDFHHIYDRLVREVAGDK